MNDLSVIAADASKALTALPLVTNAIAQVQSDLTNTQYGSVVTAAADALNVAAQSVQALGNAGLIGQNDASNVEQGTKIIESGMGIIAEIEAMAARMKALVAHIF